MFLSNPVSTLKAHKSEPPVLLTGSTSHVSLIFFPVSNILEHSMKKVYKGRDIFNNLQNGRDSYSMAPQARYWILTIPHHLFTPFLPAGCNYIIGQLELGKEESGGSRYLHWQLVVGFNVKVRLASVRRIFGNSHAEPTDSEAAELYCWKEDTRVEGTQFKLGTKAIKRSCSSDWDEVRRNAKEGNFDSIPSDIYIRCFSSLKKIACEYSKPLPMERRCYVFVGPTGTGKSRRAWDEATFDAYPKSPTSKFWDGYRGQENVVIDEFRGQIEISHILRWLDRYPVLVEVKGSSEVLSAKSIWITSNVHPENWYPTLDQPSVQALLRRLIVTVFSAL